MAMAPRDTLSSSFRKHLDSDSPLVFRQLEEDPGEPTPEEEAEIIAGYQAMQTANSSSAPHPLAELRNHQALRDPSSPRQSRSMVQDSPFIQEDSPFTFQHIEAPEGGGEPEGVEKAVQNLKNPHDRGALSYLFEGLANWGGVGDEFRAGVTGAMKSEQFDINQQKDLINSISDPVAKLGMQLEQGMFSGNPQLEEKARAYYEKLKTQQIQDRERKELKEDYALQSQHLKNQISLLTAQNRGVKTRSGSTGRSIFSRGRGGSIDPKKAVERLNLLNLTDFRAAADYLIRVEGLPPEIVPHVFNAAKKAKTEKALPPLAKAFTTGGDVPELYRKAIENTVAVRPDNSPTAKFFLRQAGVPEALIPYSTEKVLKAVRLAVKEEEIQELSSANASFKEKRAAISYFAKDIVTRNARNPNFHGDLTLRKAEIDKNARLLGLGPEDTPLIQRGIDLILEAKAAGASEDIRSSIQKGTLTLEQLNEPEFIQKAYPGVDLQDIPVFKTMAKEKIVSDRYKIKIKDTSAGQLLQVTGLEAENLGLLVPSFISLGDFLNETDPQKRGKLLVSKRIPLHQAYIGLQQQLQLLGSEERKALTRKNAAMNHVKNLGQDATPTDRVREERANREYGAAEETFLKVKRIFTRLDENIRKTPDGVRWLDPEKIEERNQESEAELSTLSFDDEESDEEKWERKKKQSGYRTRKPNGDGTITGGEFAPVQGSSLSNSIAHKHIGVNLPSDKTVQPELLKNYPTDLKGDSQLQERGEDTEDAYTSRLVETLGGIERFKAPISKEEVQKNRKDFLVEAKNYLKAAVDSTNASPDSSPISSAVFDPEGFREMSKVLKRALKRRQIITFERDQLIEVIGTGTASHQLWSKTGLANTIRGLGFEQFRALFETPKGRKVTKVILEGLANPKIARVLNPDPEIEAKIEYGGDEKVNDAERVLERSIEAVGGFFRNNAKVPYLNLLREIEGNKLALGGDDPDPLLDFILDFRSTVSALLDGVGNTLAGKGGPSNLVELFKAEGNLDDLGE